MLRDNLVGLIEPMLISAGADPLALSIQKRASDDRPACLENPRPEGAESSLTENVTSPFQAEPAQAAALDGTGLNNIHRAGYGSNNNLVVTVTWAATGLSLCVPGSYLYCLRASMATIERHGDWSARLMRPGR